MASKRQPAPLSAPTTMEKRYLKAITASLITPFADPLVKALGDARSLDDFMLAVQNIFAAYPVSDVADLIANGEIKALDAHHRSKLIQLLSPAFGVDIRPLMPESAMQPVMLRKIRENAMLISSVPSYLQNLLVKDITKSFSNAGFDRQAIYGSMKKKFGLTHNRAKLIARDQVSKTIGVFTQERHRQLGIEEYIWRTAKDPAVVGKPGGIYPKGNAKHGNHYEREGIKFRWDDPPFDGHPGQAIQCRCRAQAVIPGVN